METMVKWRMYLNMLCLYIYRGWKRIMLIFSFHTLLAVSQFICKYCNCFCLVPHEEGLLGSTVAFLDSS